MKKLYTKLKKHLFRNLFLLFLILLGGEFFPQLCQEPQKKQDLCTDPALVSMLKNDYFTPEFVLDGIYYTLPCSINCFLENGWTAYELYSDLYVGQVLLPPHSTYKLRLVDTSKVSDIQHTDGYDFSAKVINNTDKNLHLNDPAIMIYEVGIYSDLVLSFVTKFGIELNTHPEVIREALSSGSLEEDKNSSTGLITLSWKLYNPPEDNFYCTIQVIDDGEPPSYIMIQAPHPKEKPITGQSNNLQTLSGRGRLQKKRIRT